MPESDSGFLITLIMAALGGGGLLAIYKFWRLEKPRRSAMRSMKALLLDDEYDQRSIERLSSKAKGFEIAEVQKMLHEIGAEPMTRPEDGKEFWRLKSE